MLISFVGTGLQPRADGSGDERMNKLRRKIYMTAGYNTVSMGTGRKEFHPKKPRPGLEDYIFEAGRGTLKQVGGAANIDEGVIGKILVADSLADSDPAKKIDQQLVKDLATVSKDSISTFHGHAFDSLNWALFALKQLPDGLTLADQRAKVRDALENKIKDFPTTHGLYTTSPTDHLGFQAAEFSFVIVKDGKFVVLPKDQWK